MSTRTFQAIWPILDSSMSTGELIREASALLPRMVAMRAHRILPGVRPEFSRRLGSDVPGSGGAHEVIFAVAQVVPRPKFEPGFEEEGL